MTTPSTFTRPRLLTVVNRLVMVLALISLGPAAWAACPGNTRAYVDAGVGGGGGDGSSWDDAFTDLQDALACPGNGDNDALPSDDVDLDDDGVLAEPLPLDRGDRPHVKPSVVDMGAYETNPLSAGFDDGLAFDGADDYLLLTSAGPELGDAYTVELLARRTAFGRRQVVFSRDDSLDNEGLVLGFTAGDQFFCGHYGDALLSGVSFTDNDWHHWACVIDQVSGTRALYVDATLLASDTVLPPSSSPAVFFVLGSSLELTGNTFGGELDEFRFWDTARSELELRTHMGLALPGDQAGLQLYYNFNRGSGGVAISRTQNSTARFRLGNPGDGDAAEPAWIDVNDAISVATMVYAVAGSSIGGLLPGEDTDHYPDPDPITYEIVDSSDCAGFGALGFGGDGSFTFANATGAYGQSCFLTYRVNDGDSVSAEQNFTITFESRPPQASNVTFESRLMVGLKQEGEYDYFDPDGNPESGSTFQWWRADDATGANASAIDGANGRNYTATLNDAGLWLAFGVRPWDGRSVFFGDHVVSAFQGPVVGCPGASVAYVDDDAGAGANDGSSWADAYGFLQDGINASKKCPSVDQVRVAAGVYYPDDGADPEVGKSVETFEIDTGINLYGGYSGNGDERDPAVYLSVLSGDIDHDDVNDDGNFISESYLHLNGTNSEHVLRGGSSFGFGRLDGFVVTGGFATGSVDDGGGMYAPFSRATLNDVKFIGNRATDGGGIFTSDVTTRLTRVVFEGNFASNRGGGFFGFVDSSTLEDVRFVSNSANLAGGGMYVHGLGNPNGPKLTNVVFLGNTIVFCGGGGGGGMFNSQSETELTNVVFSGNSANHCGGFAPARGGGMYVEDVEDPDDLFASSTPTLVNTTFSGNSATQGGGLYADYAEPLEMSNSILYGNQAVDTGDDFYLNHSVLSTSYNLWGSQDGEGSSLSGDAATNIVDQDPLFVSPVDAAAAPITTGDLRLLSDSPAIDRGDNDRVVVTEDADGNLRISGDSVDMGAYELAQQRLLTFAAAPVGGTVSDGGGLLCGTGGGTCSQFYTYGGTVDLHAAAGPGNSFQGWDGDCAAGGASSSYSFVITEDMACVAVFVDPVLTVSPAPAHGTVTDGGSVVCGSAGTACSESYPRHTPVTLTASADPGFLFLGWSADCGAGADSAAVTITLSSDRTCTATFANDPGGDVLYVDTDATGANDGSTWTDALLNLQDALELRRVLASGVSQIWVAAGVYYPDEGGGTAAGDRAASFDLSDNLAVYGGFAGGETALDQRDPQHNRTVLSGDVDQDDTDHDGNRIAEDTADIRGGNSYSVVLGGSGSVLDGVVVTAGHASGSSSAQESGGGVNNSSGVDFTLRAAVIVGNFAQSYGSGLYTAQPMMASNVVFTGNEADPLLSGAAYVESSAATFNNLTTHGNAGYEIYLDFDAEAEINNSVVWDSDLPAAIRKDSGGTALIRNSIVAGSNGSGAGWDADVGTDGGGNRDQDPRFVSSADLRLRTDSPAIDAGNNAVLTETVDADGNPRVSPLGGTVDMGAYESSLALTVSPAPSDGTIIDGAALRCGADGAVCVQNYSSGAPVSLTAVPAPGHYFGAWSGGCSGSDETYNFTMNGNRTCGATFLQPVLTIDPQPTAGTIDGVGALSCGSTGTGVCTEAVLLGESLTLTANPDSGYLFVAWSGDCAASGSNPIHTFTVTEHSTGCGATFAKPTLRVDPVPGNGAVSSDATLACGEGSTACAESRDAGDTVTLTATPAAGYFFTGWLGECAGGGDASPYAFTIAADTTCGAGFARPVLTIDSVTGPGTVVSASSLACGGGSTVCSETYSSGDSVTLTANADPGFRLVAWGGDCGGGGNTSPYSFTIDASMTCSALFSARSLEIAPRPDGGTVSDGEGLLACGAGGVSCAVTYALGAAVTLTATPESGHSFLGWSGDCGVAGDGSEVNLTLDQDLSCGATFSQCPAGGVIHVDDSAAGLNHGGDWANALFSLQDALSLAAACPSVTEVWVAGGLYYPDQGGGAVTDDREQSFELQSDLAIYGGFAGTESTLAERDLDWANPSILSGDIDGNDDNSDGNHVPEELADIVGDNAYHVVLARGTDGTSVLDGFVLTAGLANGVVAHPVRQFGGGGAIIQGSTATLRNLLIVGNHASDAGSGLMTRLHGDPVLENVVLTGNFGSALANSFRCDPILNNVTITGNQGLAVHNTFKSTTTIINSIVWGNEGSILNNASADDNISATFVSHSIVEGAGTSGVDWDDALAVDNGGNIDSDPLFRSADSLRPRLGSPAIDAGDNALVNTSEDMDSNPRVFPAAGTVDMGAFELGPVIDVTDTGDVVAIDGVCSLREAIHNANANSETSGGDCPPGFGADTILLPAGTYLLAPGGADDDLNASGDLDVTDPAGLTLLGVGARTTIVDGGGTSGVATDRVFDVHPGADLELEGLTVQNGSLSPPPPPNLAPAAKALAEGGGGIRSQGTLELTEVRLHGNASPGPGGGLLVTSGTARIRRCLFDGNLAHTAAGATGGAIAIGAAAGAVTLEHSTLSGNVAAAGTGGGLSHGGSLDLTARYLTVTANSSGVDRSGSGGLTFESSIITGNITDDCGSAVISGGYNVFGSNGDASGCPVGTDDIVASGAPGSVIDPLADNGGATDTHGVYFGSPAIDLVPTSVNGCGDSQIEDQRRQPRPDGGACEAGAYEGAAVPVELMTFNIE